jgi:hypothetical protein
MVLPRLTGVAREVAYARAREEFVVAYDRMGAELWRRHVGRGFDAKQLSGALESYAWVGDVDGDGHSEVIVNTGWNIGPTDGGEPNITCFKPDGSIRWAFRETTAARFGSGDFSPTYRTSSILVRDLDGDGRLEVVVLATHVPFSPSVAVLLAGSTGDVLGRYWHWGYLTAVIGSDADGDGVEEIYLGGQSNAFGLASLAVLDLRALDGHGPVPDSLRPQIKASNHKAYLLFPRSPLAIFSSELRNSVGSISSGASGEVVVEVLEHLPDRPVSLHFIVDRSFASDRVVATDYFKTVIQQMVRDRRLTMVDTEASVSELGRDVLFWDGRGFRRAVQGASERVGGPMGRGGVNR